MKYISFKPAAGMPFVVLFSPHIGHESIANLINQPVQGAGFVAAVGPAPVVVGRSVSLDRGPHYLDADLVRLAFEQTAEAHPQAAARFPDSASPFLERL